MKFKVTIEKLKKGWLLSLPVASERKGRELIADLARKDQEAGETGKKLVKLRGTLKKVGSARFVSVYRSKLKHTQELVKDSFIGFRDQNQAGS